MNLCFLTALFNHKSNPRMIENFHTFKQNLSHELAVIEVVMDAEDFITDGLQLRTDSETGMMYQRENLINILYPTLDPKYDAIAWVDADLLFSPNIVEKTLTQLHTHPVVQMFSEVNLLDYAGNVVDQKMSCGMSLMRGHTGYAWAARREFLDKIDGLFPYDVFGGADSRMRWSFSQRQPLGYKNTMCADLWRRWTKWTATVEANMSNRFCCVHDTIRHLPHGSPIGRQYSSRMKISRQLGYNFETDIEVDPYGLYHFTNHNPKLIEWVRGWLRAYHQEPVEATKQEQGHDV